MTPVNALYLC